MKRRGAWRRPGRRALAFFMAVVFVLSGMEIDSSVVARAAQTESVTDTVKVGETSSSNPVYVKFTKTDTIAANKWGPNSPSQELSQYELEIVNNTDTDISDWELTITCNSIQVWNSGWNGVSRSGNKIIVGTCKTTDKEGNVWDNMTIAAGKSAGGAGFQVDSNALSGASYTLTYNLGASTGKPSQDDTLTDPSQIGSTSSQVTATLTQQTIAGGYHEYCLQVKNGLSESISDWVVAIPLTGVTGVQNWASEGWPKVQAYYTSEYLYVSPVGGAVIAAGATFGSATEGAYKFNYTGSNNVNDGSAVVYYKTGSSSTGAFDAVIDNANVDSGSGGGDGGGGSGTSQTDTTTDLGLDIEYNFAKLLQESLYFYDANMCGEIEDVCGISWRGNCHLDDKKVTYGGKSYDVSGGFHDAGDHVKFGLPQGYSSSVLAMAYREFGDAFDELGQTEHYQTIMDHFCDYYVRSTIYDGSTVKAFCYQVGDGGADHGYWGAPENQSGSRPAWFADSSNPATDEVSVAITTLALHAANFKDSAKSAAYLKTAKDLFAFVKKNNKECATKGAAGFYDSTSWKDDYSAAAIALYKATDDQAYLSEFKSYYGSLDTGWVLTWANMWPIAAMLNEDWNTVSKFASYSGKVVKGYKIVDGWGSARYNTTMQFVGLVYDKAKDTFTTGDGNYYCSWATGQMKYLLGNNDTKRCFVVGYNENSSKFPHHRAASRSNDANSTREDHYTLLGALVGGPDGDGNYRDSQGDYNCNEVALDYNAGMVGAAAGLYLLHKGNADFETELASESELEAVGVTKYYGTGSTTVPKTALTDADITFPTAAGITYGDTLAKAALSKTKDAYGTYAWENSTVKPDAGTKKYNVVYTPSNTKEYDYTALTGYNAATKRVVREVTVQVAKKKLGSVVFPTVTKSSVPAGTLLKNIQLSFSKDDFGTFAWEEPDFAVTGSTTGANVVYTVSNSNNVMVDTGVNGASKDGSSVTRSVAITVTKITPTVAVPVSISVKAGTKLSEISLGAGFSAVSDGTAVPGVFTITDKDKVLTYDDNGVEITVRFTPTDTDGYKSVEKTTKVIVTKKNYESKPAAPIVSSKTATTVKLQAVDNVEYGWRAAGSSGSYKWESGNTITGLTEYTAYEFALRYKATNIYNASDSGASVQTKTNYSTAACYSVDVSRLKEDGYVEAHDGKIAYDAKTGELTLTDTDKAYTITGEGADTALSCGSAGTVILSGAVLGSIESGQNVVIKLVGSNMVKEGISGDKTVTVQNGSQTSTAGILNVTSGGTAAIAAAAIVIESGQITATGSGEAAALKATTEIDLFGGSLNANARMTPSPVIPIQAPKIVLDGCQVKSDASTVYSTEPVDKAGNLVNLCTVTYMDGDTELAEYSVKTGGDITLDNLVKKAGYKAMGWKVQGGDATVLAQGATVTVDASIVYVAEYEKITGTVSMTAAAVEDLTAGYDYDTGVAVTIVNNTNVTLEEIALSLDADTYFTLDTGSVLDLEAGAETTVTVKLKNGMGVNAQGYTVILQAACDEADIDDLEIVRRVQKAKAPKPAQAPHVADVTEDSITLAPESADGYTVEYGILQNGAYVWQTSNVFKDLDSYTTYTFSIRYAENEEMLAGDAAPFVKGTTAMSEEGKYIVDLTKLDDKKYVDAHEDTLYMDDGELVLTGSGEYTITGSDEDLTILAAKDITIHLEDASFEALDGTGNIELNIEGSSEISSTKGGVSGITSTGTVTIESENSGSLTVQGGEGAPGIRAEKIVIHSGTVTVTGGDDGAGMKVDEVTIDGGTVSVTGQGSAPAIDAKTKKISVPVTEQNGKDYKGSGGDDPTPSPSPSPTATPTNEPGKPTAKPKATAKPTAKPGHVSFVPALTTVNVLLKKGGSYKLSTNSSSVRITKVAYANKKAKKIVKVNKAGKIKAKKKGKAKLNVALSYNGRTYMKQVTVKVQKNPVRILNKSTVSIKLKRKQKCSLVNPANMFSTRGMKFTSSKKKVAAVNKKGIVTAKKKGKAKITAVMNGKKYIVKVKVK